MRLGPLLAEMLKASLALDTLSTASLAALTTTQIGSFNADQLNALSTTQLVSIETADIAALDLPTVITFEGGYAVAEVGVNAVNLLQGLVAG